jgi:hypothetical protein
VIEKTDETSSDLGAQFGPAITALVVSGGGPTSGRPRVPRARRLKHYQRSLALLEERLPQSPLVAQLREELHSCVGERTLLTPTG